MTARQAHVFFGNVGVGGVVEGKPMKLRDFAKSERQKRIGNARFSIEIANHLSRAESPSNRRISISGEQIARISGVFDEERG